MAEINEELLYELLEWAEKQTLGKRKGIMVDHLRIEDFKDEIKIIDLQQIGNFELVKTHLHYLILNCFLDFDNLDFLISLSLKGKSELIKLREKYKITFPKS